MISCLLFRKNFRVAIFVCAIGCGQGPRWEKQAHKYRNPPPFAPAQEVFYHDVWNSPDGVNRTELPGTPWLPRHAASAFVHDHTL